MHHAYILQLALKRLIKSFYPVLSPFWTVADFFTKDMSGKDAEAQLSGVLLG